MIHILETHNFKRTTMASYGEPDWASPGAATSGAPAEVVAAPPVNTGVGNKAAG